MLSVCACSKSPAPDATANAAATPTTAAASTNPRADEIRKKTLTVDAQRIIDADKEPGNWLEHGRNYSEQRFSPLNQINDKNVGDLGLAWSWNTGTTRGIEATPIVVDGVMFTSGPWSVVFAHDAKTGELLWQYDPQVPREWGKFACCDVVNRGVAVWKGKVYVGTLDGRLIALDAGTGKQVWSQLTIDKTRPYTITGAPRVVQDKVIIGNGGAEFGVRGYVTAYDAETGEQAWRFYTVPGDPSKPFEGPHLEKAAATWRSGGGQDRTGRSAAAARCGIRWPTTPSSTCSTSASATDRRGTDTSAAPAAATTCICRRSSRSTPTTALWCGTTRRRPATPGTYTATQHMILADLQIDGARAR